MKQLGLISGVDRLCEPGLNRSFSGLRRPFLMCLVCVYQEGEGEGEGEWCVLWSLRQRQRRRGTFASTQASSFIASKSVGSTFDLFW